MKIPRKLSLINRIGANIHPLTNNKYLMLEYLWRIAQEIHRLRAIENNANNNTLLNQLFEWDAEREEYVPREEVAPPEFPPNQLLSEGGFKINGGTD